MATLVTTSIFSANLFDDDLWNKYMDPRVADFPFMSDGLPRKLIGLCFIFLAVAKLWGPSVKTIDMKPWLFVWDGFAFGVHGVGILFVIILSNTGLDSFDCNPLKSVPFTGELTFDYVKTESILQLTSVLLFLRIFWMPESLIIMTITGKPPSNWRIINDIILLTITFIGIKYLPGGPSFFFILTYFVYYTIRYGYYTLKLGYPEGQEMLEKSKKYLIYLKFLWSFLTFSHYVFLNYDGTCQANPILYPVSQTELVYSVGLLLSSLSDYAKMTDSIYFKERKECEKRAD